MSVNVAWEGFFLLLFCTAGFFFFFPSSAFRFTSKYFLECLVLRWLTKFVVFPPVVFTVLLRNSHWTLTPSQLATFRKYIQTTLLFFTAVSCHIISFSTTIANNKVSSGVRYIDFLSILRYFCTYHTVSKPILHVLRFNKYRIAQFTNNLLDYLTRYNVQ